jgi:Rrf2 family transcriptional regulator, nitric oxide-sensitive transcriptional repressor
MRLTVFTEYALLVLIYLASHPDRFVTIPEIAGAYGISKNHLMKVVRHLASTADVVTLRGPHGGLRLGRPAAEIRVGDVVRRTGRPREGSQCREGSLASVLDQATAAFMAVLDGCTVADLLTSAAGPPIGPG